MSGGVLARLAAQDFMIEKLLERVTVLEAELYGEGNAPHEKASQAEGVLEENVFIEEDEGIMVKPYTVPEFLKRTEDPDHPVNT